MAEPKSGIIKETISFWKSRSGDDLSSEDAREIVENVVGFFRVLMEWDRTERKARSQFPEAETFTPSDGGDR